MQRFNVEFMTDIYVRIPVDAESFDDARQLADILMPRYPVAAEPTKDSPIDKDWIHIDKGWEITEITDENGDTEQEAEAFAEEEENEK